jgi:hypothetical protein
MDCRTREGLTRQSVIFGEIEPFDCRSKPFVIGRSALRIGISVRAKELAGQSSFQFSRKGAAL